MRKLAWSCAAILALTVTAAVAQTAGTAPCVRQTPQYGLQKTAQCRSYYQGQGMRGADLSNNTAVCVTEARLACLQKAAAGHVTVPMHNQFMATCLGA